METLKRDLSAGSTLSIEVTDAPGGLVRELRTLPGVRDVSTDPGTITVTCEADGETKLRALNAVADAGVYRDFTLREASLSEVFSEYTTDRGSGGDRAAPDAGTRTGARDEAGKYLEWGRGDR